MRSGADQRHLFVWIHAAEFSPFDALSRYGPPKQGPELRGEVTHIWLACRDGEGKPRAWRTAAAGEWESVIPS